MNIRYRIKHRVDARTETAIFSLEEVERGPMFVSWDMQGWQILSRDLGTGLKDKNGVEIFERDLLKSKYEETVKVKWHDRVAGFVLWELDGTIYFGQMRDRLEWEIIGRSDE